MQKRVSKAIRERRYAVCQYVMKWIICGDDLTCILQHGTRWQYQGIVSMNPDWMAVIDK
jgi:hypothetical protein